MRIKLQHHSIFIYRSFRLLEAVIIIMSFIISFQIFYFSNNAPFTPLPTIFNSFSLELAVFLMAWLYFSTELKLYSSKRITPIPEEIITFLKVSCIAFFFTLICHLILKFQTYDFRPLVLFWLITNILLVSFRICLRKTLRFIRAKGFNYRNIVLVGRNNRSLVLAKRIMKNDEFGLKIIGYIDESEQVIKNLEFPECIKFLGDLSQLRSILNSYIIDEVFIALPIKSFYTNIEKIVEICTERGIDVRILSDMFFLKDTKNSIDRLDGLPLHNISLRPDSILKLFIKRCIDITVSSTLLILSIPLYIVISLAIKIESPGPVFFVQKRVGCNNRTFKLLKFRTMIVKAQNLQIKLNHMNEMDGPVFKIKNDPRITRVGKILRRFSLDELPQMINVLKGDMNLVGPRPPLPAEVEKYSWSQRRRLSVKPGITGLWQVSGRNTLSFDQWVKLDLKYIDNWTLTMDLKILFKTIYIILNGKGAM